MHFPPFKIPLHVMVCYAIPLNKTFSLLKALAKREHLLNNSESKATGGRWHRLVSSPTPAVPLLTWSLPTPMAELQAGCLAALHCPSHPTTRASPLGTPGTACLGCQKTWHQPCWWSCNCSRLCRRRENESRMTKVLSNPLPFWSEPKRVGSMKMDRASQTAI